MVFDGDIKIAGDKPSQDVKKNSDKKVINNIAPEDDKKERAKALGRRIAEIFSTDTANFDIEDDSDFEMIVQRRLLLSFTATVGFETFIKDDTLSGIAQKSFLDTLKKLSSEIYKTSADTGAFSFYYLAFRRGIEIDRRIGQTFAMLCSHDGDSVYQELGEALYCWFTSVVNEESKKLGF